MANIAFSGEKASEYEVKQSLMTLLADSWEGAFAVDFWSDDGGRIVRAVVECADPNGQLEQSFVNKLPVKYMGWRLIILKVPVGHVKVFFS